MSIKWSLSSCKSVNSLWLENNLQTQALLGLTRHVQFYRTPSLQVSLRHELASILHPWGPSLSHEVFSSWKLLRTCIRLKSRWGYGGRLPGFNVSDLRVSSTYSLRAPACPPTQGNGKGTHVRELSGRLNESLFIMHHSRVSRQKKSSLKLWPFL